MKTTNFLSVHRTRNLFFAFLTIVFAKLEAQNCEITNDPVYGVVSSESFVMSNSNAKPEELSNGVVDDKGFGMNATDHYFTLDFGKVLGEGSIIKFDHVGNNVSTERKVTISENPAGLYLESGGYNPQIYDVSIQGYGQIEYTLNSHSRYIQVDMTHKIGGFKTTFVEVTVIQKCQVPIIGAIEVNYPTNPTNVDLPENTALGVNGRMLIYNGNEPIDNVTFNADIVNNFALVVAGDQAQAKDENNNLLFEADGTTPIMEDIGGGIVSRDLGIGASNLFMNLPDYVFAKDFALPSLEDTKAYVQEHKHLPAVIGKKELSEQGYFRIDRMLFGQLKHLEELLLHTITQDEKIKAQKEENERLETKYLKLLEQVERLENQKS